jgi:hypothetical protein
LDSFEAEVKRSWLTPRDSLKAAMKGGKLWIPATIALTENEIRILSSDGSIELRPLRIIWLAPNSFRVTGVVSGSGFGRSNLRFNSPELATQVASVIKSSFSVLDEPLTPVEQLPVQVRLLLHGRYVIVQLPVMLIRLALGTFFLAILSGWFGVTGILLGLALIIVYFGLPFWIVFVRARRPTQGFLRFEGSSIVVLAGWDLRRISPKVIEWRTPEVFVLRGPGVKYEFSFPTSSAANQAIMMIKAKISMIQEIPIGADR